MKVYKYVLLADLRSPDIPEDLPNDELVKNATSYCEEYVNNNLIYPRSNTKLLNLKAYFKSGASSPFFEIKFTVEGPPSEIYKMIDSDIDPSMTVDQFKKEYNIE